MLSFPLDCTGADATVEGVFDSRDPNVFKIWATAVTLSSSGNLCEEWRNEPLSGNLQDEDFYGIGNVDNFHVMLSFKGMGSGLVTLEPGGIMAEHSTNHSSEMVTCIEGVVTVRVDRGIEYVEYELEQYGVIFIPHSTPHMVINYSNDTAKYIYCHADIQMHQYHEFHTDETQINL